ncbi:MAG: hypothetical protein V2I39_09255 [Erythrobacter sp.]|nr:hypothetical protein [Erythrobacter sp.]
MDTLTKEMRAKLIEIGIISYKEQETILQIARRCAKTSGLPMAGAGAVLGMKAGTVALPGIGTVSGATAGFLGGLASGTASCVGLNLAARNELKALASGK